MNQMFQIIQGVLFIFAVTFISLYVAFWVLKFIVNKLNNPIVGIILFILSVILVKEFAGYSEEWRLLTAKTYLPSIIVAFVVFKIKANLNDTINWTAIIVTVGNVLALYVLAFTIHYPKGVKWLPLGLFFQVPISALVSISTSMVVGHLMCRINERRGQSIKKDGPINDDRHN